jgi:FecR protein
MIRIPRSRNSEIFAGAPVSARGRAAVAPHRRAVAAALQCAMLTKIVAGRVRLNSATGCILLAVAALLNGVTPSLADEGIGAANVVINSVKGNLPTGAVKVIQGDGVFRDEGLRTDGDSSAKLVLLDNTNVSLGPSSSIKLDRFVYAGPAQSGAIAINLTKGIFRFVTGNAEKRDYAITTPTAGIGVRGTILKIVATKARTIVVLEEGAATVCTRRGKLQCLDLTDPGDRVVATATRVFRPKGEADPTATTFAALCGQVGVCETTTFSGFATPSDPSQGTEHGIGHNGAPASSPAAPAGGAPGGGAPAGGAPTGGGAPAGGGGGKA